MAQQSLEIWRGETLSVTWTMAPVEDVTGWLFLMTFSKQPDSSQKVLQVAPAVSDAPAGKFAVILSSAQTALLAPGRYSWDVWRNNAGQERLLAFGVVTVRANARFPA